MKIFARGIKLENLDRAKECLEKAFASHPEVRMETARSRVGVVEVVVSIKPDEVVNRQVTTGRIDCILIRNGQRFCNVTYCVDDVSPVPPAFAPGWLDYSLQD